MVCGLGGVSIVACSSDRVCILTLSCLRLICGGGRRGRTYIDMSEICVSLRMRNDSGKKGGVSHAMYTSDSFISCTNNAPHLPVPAVVGGVVVVSVVVVST